MLKDENYSFTFLCFDVVIGQLTGKAIVSASRLLYSYKTEQYTFVVYFLVDTFIMFAASYWRLPLHS